MKEFEELENIPKKILDLDYICVFDDGTIAVNDGVGYIDTIPKNQVIELMWTLNDLFPGDKEDYL